MRTIIVSVVRTDERGVRGLTETATRAKQPAAKAWPDCIIVDMQIAK